MSNQNQHPSVKQLLAERLRTQGYRILKRESLTDRFLATFTPVSDELRPCDGDDSLETAVEALVVSVVHLQSVLYEAQASMKSAKASKVGQLLDVGLGLLDQLVEVQNE